MDLNKPSSGDEPGSGDQAQQQPQYQPPQYPPQYGQPAGYPPQQQPYATPPGYTVPPGYQVPPGYPPSSYPPYPPYGGQQPYGYGQQYGAGEPPSSVAWVVVGFIFFWPLGIASLLAQLKIGPAWYAGDRASALLYADQAKTRGKIAMWLGIVWIVIVIAVFAATINSACSGFNC